MAIRSKCCYKGCNTSKSTKNSNISYHKFPITKSKLCMDWLKNAAVGDELFKEFYSEEGKKTLGNRFICSLHFDSKYFNQRILHRRKLLGAAVPHDYKEKLENEPATETQNLFNESTKHQASSDASIDSKEPPCLTMNAAEDMEVFYSRCLLCTRTPDVTPHLHIFSEAANQLELSEKINKYLNIQIESELPQNVCHGCMEKLEVTHGLVMSSQQARVTLLQIKQQSGNFVHEVKQEIPDCLMTELDGHQPAIDSATNHNMNKRTNEIPMGNPNCSSSREFDQPNSALRSTAENTVPFEEVFISTLDIEEHAIKQELGENQLECFYRNDVMEHVLESRLQESVPKLLECDFCTFNTDNKTELTTHMQAHQASNTSVTSSTWSKNPSLDDDDDEVKCHECGIRYVHREMLKWHIELCHGDNAIVRIEKISYKQYNFVCVLCKSVFNEFKMVTRHLRSQHRLMDLPFRCNVCHKTFISSGVCKKHESNCYGRKTNIIISPIEVTQNASCSSINLDDLKCNVCNKEFNSKNQFRKHNSTFHPQRRRGMMHFKCGHCHDSFNSFSALKAHCLRKHPGKCIIACDVCGTEFTSNLGYMDHKKYAHGTHGFGCNLCCATFSRPNNLKSHIKNVHSKLQETSSCNICHANFKRPKYLRTHILEAHASPIIHCMYCDYSTRKKEYLTNHINSKHLFHNRQIFPCTLCGDEFKFKTHLHRHIRGVHTGTMMHCEFCQYSTCRKTGLIKHLKFKHVLFENN